MSMKLRQRSARPRGEAIFVVVVACAWLAGCSGQSTAIPSNEAVPPGAESTREPGTSATPQASPSASVTPPNPQVSTGPGADPDVPSATTTLDVNSEVPTSSASSEENSTGETPEPGDTGGMNGESSAGGTSDAEFPNTNPGAGCAELVSDPNINWRNSGLQTDQEIVECLAQTLGRPVGYGENARGGYDPNGGSRLVIITKDGAQSVEDQIVTALSGDEPAWIVFDKVDFAAPSEIALYRRHCDDATVLSQLGATAAECRDHRVWCSSRGHTGDACLEQFFNVTLNDSAIPIRNPVIGSNKTLDGRMSEAYFLFSGFAIGADSSGSPTQTSENVVLTHLNFQGAGHTEDHGLDPDMIRSTGSSHDIWIHKNDFELTGDSAFDVKVGAYAITMSFNRVLDVKRAALHGSSDNHTIDEQITTTMHHNAFVTRDALYETFGNTARRVPLIRRGKSHMWNNLFVNYRKDIVSVRVDAQLLWEDNALVVNNTHQEKSTVDASLSELGANLVRDVSGGSYRGTGNLLWFSNASCVIDNATRTPIAASAGTVGDLSAEYSPTSRTAMTAHRRMAGQELIDYVSATAGRNGLLPFNSPLAPDVASVPAQGRAACQ